MKNSIALEARKFAKNRDLGLGDTSPGPVDAYHRCRDCPRGWGGMEAAPAAFRLAHGDEGPAERP